MTARYQVEALLRPAVELWSSLLAFTMATIVMSLHGYLFLPSLLALAGGTFFAGYGTWRLWQGIRIVRYKRRLGQQPRFSIRRGRIPVSTRKLYLGRGFRWQARHTQRLRDCLQPDNVRFLRQPRRQVLAQSIAASLEQHGLHTFASMLLADSVLNPFRPPPAVGGRPEIHGVGMWEGERNLYSPIGERVGHTLVLGTTRTGKTRFAEILINQDIRRGDTVIVFDPKGNTDLMLSMYSACRGSGRLKGFRIFHLAHPEHSARYNPVGSYSRITQVATRIANALPDSGNSSAFKEFGWRFTNIIAQALDRLGEPPTYRAIQTHVNNIDGLLIRYGRWWLDKYGPGNWTELLALYEHGLTGSKDDPTRPVLPALTPSERSRDIRAVCMARVLTEVFQSTGKHDPIAEGLLSACKYDRTYFDKIVSSLLPFLEKLSTGAVSALFNPNHEERDAESVFDWMSVINQRGVVYVGLAALQDVTVASAVGNAMFADLTAVAGELYANGPNPEVPGSGSRTINPISLHADEFNELIGDEFIPMLNKAGGAGFQVTAYTQTWSDVEARTGNRAKAEQIEGNFNTVVMLRVRSKKTAELLTDMLPNVQVSHLTTVSIAQHQNDPGSSQHFGSSVQDRVSTSDAPMLEPGDLTRLPKGHAFLVMEGGQLYKLRVPLPAPDRRPLPDGIRELAELMRGESQGSADWQQDHWWNRSMPTDQQTSEDFRDMLLLTGPVDEELPDSSRGRPGSPIHLPGPLHPGTDHAGQPDSEAAA
ncbi:MAG: type IV conjugative transfer system coupling protein TraD [Gammaproteobacteria bacterium]|nr:type IV conjugative transfer system coupling protein TraD [Gammaproteobacteria bacterium]MYG68410.1 type IV conjugative transfer system coupling protein TraD [Gammaproteobacteria bacterium]